MTISVTVLAVDSAPLVNLAWLFCSASMADLRTWSICSGLMSSGPCCSQPLTPSMLAVTCLANAGTPSMNWVMTNVRMPPTTAMPLSRTSATAPPRGAPRRARKSTGGSNKAARMIASATGTKINSRRLNAQSNATTAARITNSRQAHAAALRTRGVTDSSATESTDGPASMPVA